MMWIPVTASLPIDAEEVIVTWVNHDPEPYYAHVKDVPYTGFAVYYNGNWYWWTSVSKDLIEEYGNRIDLLDKVDDAIQITAWMPMPKPYERKEEFDCNDCYYSMQNCNDRSICCEDETALCDDFEPVANRKEE